ncbi:MAG: hypothetical protein AAF726_03275 [Planctomycetota bacterium]
MNANAALTLIAGAMIAVAAFVLGSRLSAAGAPERDSEPHLSSEELTRVRDLLDDALGYVNERARSDVELAPISPGGARQIPLTQIEGLVERIDAVVRRLESLESTGVGAGSLAGAPRDWREVERDVDRLRRPTDQPALQRFVERYRETIEQSDVPLEISLLGVREVIDRFGWPEELLIPQIANGSYELTYRVAPETEDASGTITVYCTQFRTYYATFDL